MRHVAILVRHGQYAQPEGMPSAHLLYGLTDEGRAQARQGAQQIAEMARTHGWQLDEIIDTSSLLRAWETAKIIADTLVEMDVLQRGALAEFDELAERGVGAAANLTVDEIEAIIARDPRRPPLPEGWKRTPSFRLPVIGAESQLEAGRRTARILDEQLERLAGGDDEDSADAASDEPSSGDDEATIARIFVGHGGAFRLAAYHLGVLELDDVDALSMYHCVPVALERPEDGVVPWRQVAGEWKVRSPMEASD